VDQIVLHTRALLLFCLIYGGFNIDRRSSKNSGFYADNSSWWAAMEFILASLSLSQRQ